MTVKLANSSLWTQLVAWEGAVGLKALPTARAIPWQYPVLLTPTEHCRFGCWKATFRNRTWCKCIWRGHNRWSNAASSCSLIVEPVSWPLFWYDLWTRSTVLNLSEGFTNVQFIIVCEVRSPSNGEGSYSRPRDSATVVGAEATFHQVRNSSGRHLLMRYVGNSDQVAPATIRKNWSFTNFGGLLLLVHKEPSSVSSSLALFMSKNDCDFFNGFVFSAELPFSLLSKWSNKLVSDSGCMNFGTCFCSCWLLLTELSADSCWFAPPKTHSPSLLKTVPAFCEESISSAHELNWQHV